MQRKWNILMAAVAGSLVAMLPLLHAAPARAQASACVVGNHVLVAPGDHPATVLAGNASSCRVHYEDAAFPDGWTYTFNIKAAAASAATAATAPRTGRYDITVGTGAYDGYLVLRSANSYELFLPSGQSGGSGTYSFDPASRHIRWMSGPLTDARWDGTQAVEADHSMTKIRIGARAVATNTGR
jgi:hypothetical protein